MFFYFTCSSVLFFLFFFNDTATTEIYTLSLHDALPIFPQILRAGVPVSVNTDDPGIFGVGMKDELRVLEAKMGLRDRKSTRLNSSHVEISYAVFCLKKKKKINKSK